LQQRAGAERFAHLASSFSAPAPVAPEPEAGAGAEPEAEPDAEPAEEPRPSADPAAEEENVEDAFDAIKHMIQDFDFDSSVSAKDGGISASFEGAGLFTDDDDLDGGSPAQLSRALGSMFRISVDDDDDDDE
jgi:hypothetical protein